MKIFAYGTLIDDRVRGGVLGRDHDDVTPAKLTGLKPVYAAGCSFPILIDDPEFVCEGLVMNNLSDQDVKHLDWYEGGLYERETRTVVLEDGTEEEVMVYIPNDNLSPTDRVWRYSEWRL